MDRSAWAWMPVAALLLGLAGPPPRPESPAPPAASPRPSSTRRRASPAPAAGPAAAARPPRRRPAGGARPLATGLTLQAGPARPGRPSGSRSTWPRRLRLSDARPLVVAAAQASVWVAEAELTRAKVLWVPTLNIGFDYIRHDGGGPDFNKGIMTAPSVNFFYGGGGLIGNLPLTDAIFEPLVARQVLNAGALGHPDGQERRPAPDRRRLLPRPPAPRDLRRAPCTPSSGAATWSTGSPQLSRRAGPQGRGRPGAEHRWPTSSSRPPRPARSGGSQSANLTQVLRLDPRAVVEPLEHDHAQITLIDPGRPLDDLMPVALTNRPELASHQALVQAAVAGDPPREGAAVHRPTSCSTGSRPPTSCSRPGSSASGPTAASTSGRAGSTSASSRSGSSKPSGSATWRGSRRSAASESRAIIEFFEDPGHGGRRRDPGPGPASSRPRSGSSRPTAPCGRRSSPSTATSRASGRPPGSATSWSWSTGPRRRSSPSSSSTWPSTSISPRSPTTTGPSSSCSTPWATRPARSPRCGRPGESCRSTRAGPATCPRWATARRRPPDDARPRRDTDRTFRHSRTAGGLVHALRVRSRYPPRPRAAGGEATCSARRPSAALRRPTPGTPSPRPVDATAGRRRRRSRPASRSSYRITQPEPIRQRPC